MYTIFYSLNNTLKVYKALSTWFENHFHDNLHGRYSAVKFCQKTRDFFNKCMASSAVKFFQKTCDFFSKFYRDLNSIFFFVELVF